MAKKQIFVLATIFIGLFILLNVGWSYKNANTMHVHTVDTQKQTNSENILDSVEYIYSEQEQNDIKKWKNKTMDELVQDAYHGDPAALWMIGTGFLTGTMGLPLNVEFAGTFYAQSASLGFAPSLNEIIQMYITDEPNAFLSLVYENLTITFGHTEFIQHYHDSRIRIIESCSQKGKRIVDEIDRIAMQKKAIILKNQKYVQEKQKNKEICWLSKNITDEDYQYDNDYWLDVYTNDNETLNFSELEERDKIYFEKLYAIYDEAISSDNNDFNIQIEKVALEMKKNSYSNSEIEILTKQARSLAKKNYKYFLKIENNANESKKNIKILKQFKESIKEFN